MTDVWFFQLRQKTLEQVLPALLEKTRERDWRAVVQVGTAERLEAIDEALWTYRDDSFLPHGSARDGDGRDGDGRDQPVWLTVGTDNPNAAHVRFLVDGAIADSADGYQRLVYIFDGDDPEATITARETWKRMKTDGHAISFYQQNEQGQWTKRA